MVPARRKQREKAEPSCAGTHGFPGLFSSQTAHPQLREGAGVLPGAGSRRRGALGFTGATIPWAAFLGHSVCGTLGDTGSPCLEPKQPVPDALRQPRAHSGRIPCADHSSVLLASLITLLDAELRKLLDWSGRVWEAVGNGVTLAGNDAPIKLRDLHHKQQRVGPIRGAQINPLSSPTPYPVSVGCPAAPSPLGISPHKPALWRQLFHSTGTCFPRTGQLDRKSVV